MIVETCNLHVLFSTKCMYCHYCVFMVLENVEHCEDEPEQADAGILSLMSELVMSKIQIFNVRCKLTRWTPHYLTPRRWIYWMRQRTPHRTCRLSSLAFLTSVCSDLLHSCYLWRRCSLAVALSSHSRCNLSFALSRFIGIELHGEESSVTFIAQNIEKL